MSIRNKTAHRVHVSWSARGLLALLVSLLFLVQPMAPLLPSAEATASDWGEPVGSIMLQHRWGHGDSANLTLTSVELKGGTFKLTTSVGSINMTGGQVKSGTRTNITITRYDALVLTSQGPSFVRKNAWDLPTFGGNTMPRFVDIDNDGDYDCLASIDTGDLVGYNNTGTIRSPNWTLQPAWNKTLVASAYAVATFGDLDNDGDYDMLAGDNLGPSLGWNNTGNKSWPQWTRKAAWDVPAVAAGAAPYLADLDADGDLDLVVGENAGVSYAFNNTGTKASPVWTAKTAWDLPTAQSVPTPTLGDLDLDGDLDALVGRFVGDTRGYTNTGTATNPTWTRNNNWDLPDIGKFAAPDMVDIDGDGDKDVIMGSDIGVNWAYENVGVKPTTGTFLSPALDAGAAVNWSKVKWSETLPANTDVTLYVRTGNSTNPGDGSWSGWSGALSTPGGSDVGSPVSRRIQVRAVLTSTVTSSTPVLWGINVTYWRFVPTGSLATNALKPSGLVKWGNLTVARDLKGQNVTVSYSVDNGSTWSAAPADGNLSGASIAQGSIRFRADLTTALPNISPELTGLTMRYMTLLSAHHMHIRPASSEIVVGTTLQLTGELHDINNNTLDTTLNWSADNGTIDQSGKYTAPHTTGSAIITLKALGIQTNASISIIPGPLSKISVLPTELVANGGSKTQFDAKCSDAYGNKLIGLAVNWTTDVGTVEPASGNNTTFTAKVPPKGGQNLTGTVQASLGAISAKANITVLGDASRVLKFLSISPINATLESGNTQLFNAWGTDQLGDKMNITAEWTSDVGTMFPSRGQSSTLTVTMNGGGKGNVTATVGELSIWAPITVIKNNTYPYPKISGIVPDQLKFEDDKPWNLDLNKYEAGGVNDEAMLWHIEGLNTSLVQVSGEFGAADVLSFTLVPNANGKDDATLVLQDQLGYRASQKLWINVTPVNDAPVLNTIPDIIVRYDESYSFNYLPYIVDIDTAVSGLSLAVIDTEPKGKPFTATVSGFDIIYNAPKSLVGQGFVVTIQVSDGTNTVKDSLTVIVSSDWVPVIRVPLPDVTMREGETKLNVFNLDDHFEDKDKDVIYFSYGNTHVDIKINTNNSVDVTASSEWSGQELVTFRATDSKGALVEDNVLVTVYPFNDPPTLGLLPDLGVHYDAEYTFDLTPYISDVDTPTSSLSLSFSGQDVWWAWDPAQQQAHPPKQGTSRLTMVINMPDRFGGRIYSVVVNVTVSDGYSTAKGTVRIVVSDDWPPNLNAPMPDLEFDEDMVHSSALKLGNYFTDPEAGTLKFQAHFKNINLTIRADGTVDLSAPKDWYGIEQVTFRATDPKGGLKEDTIVVTVRPVNDPPTMDSIADQTTDAKALINVPLGALIHDVDDPVTHLNINVSGSDPSLKIFLSGTDAVLYSEVKGDYTVTVTVTDSAGASAQQTFHVKVKAVKGPGPRTKSFLEVWALPIFLLIIMLICLVVAFVGYRRYYGKYKVDDAFVILRDGRLISHLSRNPSTKKDEVVFSGMVAALQMFVEDAFKDMDTAKSGSVQRMEYKGNNILVEKGNHMYLALLFSGTPGKKLYTDMKNVLGTIENKHSSTLKDWDGDMTHFGDLPHYLMKFLPGGFTNPVKIESNPEHKELIKEDKDRSKNN